MLGIVVIGEFVVVIVDYGLEGNFLVSYFVEFIVFELEDNDEDSFFYEGDDEDVFFVVYLVL